MHLTVRMAWHDNNWDGKICCNPEGNTYCTGAHSLLSSRIEKRKKTEFEQEHKGESIAGNFSTEQVPPCYWSINAFGKSAFEVEHNHAFSSIKHTIKDIVKPYSVYTWPFKLSFIHNPANKKSHGNYPANLEKRIDDFINQFTPKQSVIFFYANYDNPVSADDMKYLLLGCSVINELPEPKHFPFTDEDLDFWRSGKNMQNFPTINWAIQFSHDPEKAVLLPYREYINYAEDHPEDEEKLHQMKVVIEEESLVRGFKYVAMDIDDDKCLYLLYKLRKSIKKIQGHEQLVVKSTLEKEEQKITNLIQSIWEKRGIYPSLPKVLNYFVQDDSLSHMLAESISAITEPKNDLLKVFKSIVDEEIPEVLEEHEDDLLDIADQRLFDKSIDSLARLSLFNLTQHQVNKIIKNGQILNSLSGNPYILYEEYKEDEDDLDIPQMQDEPIDVYKIDVGMIPDRKFVKRHRKLQNLQEDSPERVRSVIINYLWQIGEQGHCYDHAHNLLTDLKEHPLIYKNDIHIDENALINLDSDYKTHFIEKLHIKEVEGERYFYLQSIQKAEEQIRYIVELLINRSDHTGVTIDYNSHIQGSLTQLSEVIVTEENKVHFRNERQKLYGSIFNKSLYLLTGKPGAGKTYETSKVIEHLNELNEEIEILAPTGKAALRLTENIRENTGNTDLTAKTIDRFLFKNGFHWVHDDWDRLEKLPESEKLTLENLIIDECSMIDLSKLKMLFSVVRFNENYPKRIIMVGDENQLPPIGFGKPFHDIINYVIKSNELTDHHYINLTSNCRQENDEKILTLAEAFTDKKRYYEEALELIKQEGKASEGLHIHKWENQTQLKSKVSDAIETLFCEEDIPETLSPEERLNTLFGLYKNGHVNNQNFKFKETMNLEAFQALTPYRTGYYGTIGLNKLLQKGYRSKGKSKKEEKYFTHGDKIIRMFNWYMGNGKERNLALSNGSIGIVTVNKSEERKYFFKEFSRPWKGVDNEENFDLAYAISIHKSQGSDFRNIFLVIPNKLSLLSKELIYTALTRSKYRLFLFIQKIEDGNLLEYARNISHLSSRNTSIFEAPKDNRIKLLPDPHNKPVKSRIEYIIYKSLQKSGLTFEYEKRLKFEKREYDIHPDFTIHLKSGKTIYWEHLGMLDVRKYYHDWQKRKKDYQDHNFFEQVVTTDDLGGIYQEKIDELIMAIREDELKNERDNKFSHHHYELY